MADVSSSSSSSLSMSSSVSTMLSWLNSLIDSEWMPLHVLTRRVFLCSLTFYIVLGVLSRIFARKYWPKDNEDDAKRFNFISDNRKRETWGRWLPSLIHAIFASSIATIACFALLPSSIVSNEDVIMHSLGYFLGDLFVDRDPEYFAHHVGPVLHSECMLRLGALFWHTMRAGMIMEYGNIIAHTAALITFRKGTVWHRINTWSFWISRPLSYYDGFLAWYSDIPSEKRWTIMGIIPLIGVLGVYISNTKWMIQMCRPRRPKPIDTNVRSNGNGDASPSSPSSSPSSSNTDTSPTTKSSSIATVTDIDGTVTKSRLNGTNRNHNHDGIGSDAADTDAGADAHTNNGHLKKLN